MPMGSITHRHPHSDRREHEHDAHRAGDEVPGEDTRPFHQVLTR